MNLVELKCPNCGGELKIDTSEHTCVCNFCSSKLLIENGSLSLDTYDSGYQFEQGRHQAEIERHQNRKNIKLTPAYHRDKPQKQGCYVATCVYGSYDCPEVWTLRRYRDFSLAKKWYGRVFVRLYYAISPTAVKLFGNRKWFKDLFRRGLDKKVAELRERGFDSSPYDDRKW